MANTVSDSLEYRLAVVVSLGLLIFTLLAGGITFYLGYHAQIVASSNLQRQLVSTLQAQAEVAAFASNAEIAQDVLNGLLTNDTIASVRLTSANGFEQHKAHGAAATGQLSSTTYILLSPIDKQTPIGELHVSADESVVRDAAISSAIANSLILVLQILLAVILLAIVFRRIVAKPIANLAHTLASIHPGGSERLPIDKEHEHDEVGMLSSSANNLLDAAEHALEEERQLRFKVEEMEQHYRRIFESTNVGIMVLQSCGRLINSNPILLQKIVGIHFDGKYTPDSEDFISAIFVQPEVAWAMVSEASARGRAVAADLQLKTADGSSRWAHCILSVSHDQLGKMEIIEGVLYDVTARREQEENARQRAEMDALTGIHNRHGIEIFIDRSLRHAGDDNVLVGILLIDLDGFKAVNDTLGHAAGDAVLVEVAARLRDRIRRSTDLVGRLGGDEFIVIVYNCGEGKELLAQLASDIVASLAQPIHLASGQTAQIGASIGVARYPGDGMTREILFERADRAMYEVKRRGKNNFAFAQDHAESQGETASSPDST
jgi:diguanylate cyclase (GGDEF)-like protein